ncbi:protein kinase domain-containing protein [Leptothermofonsia sp. ETS-13]|uniref:protein kinase domain-containing protein n=1 Tax=Leptothermofonsia sp. ETS-13 TaxID=3035696 RepID=UPI003B9FDAEA
MTNLLSQDGIPCLELEALLDGRYRVIQVLNTEVWGQTYLAQDTRRPSQPQCIIQHIKPIHVEPEYQDAIRHLFVREAAILEKLADHDQIPQLLACFEDEEGFYLVQEFVHGYPLSLEIQPEHPWIASEVVQLLLDSLEPLAFAHNQGIRHGNLTPEHLVRRAHNGKIVLVSFDSVRQLYLSLLSLHGQSILTTNGNEQSYQPPEQLQGMPCLASDVYAIGMIAIQALTGTHPGSFLATSNTEKNHWSALISATEFPAHEELVAILTRMVHPDCNQRYASAVEALEAVHQLIRAIPVQPVSEMALPIAGRPGTILYPTAQAELAPDHSPTKRLSPAERHGMTLMVGLGIGTVVTATTVGYAFLVNPPDQLDRGPQILEQARNQYQDGKLPQAISLAESIPITSQAYASARDTVNAWKQDWKEATSIYQKMVDALKQNRWQEVLQEAKALPQNAYWKERTADLVTQANRLAEDKATQLMVKAYSAAIAKDFTDALKILKQVPEDSTLYSIAQEKIGEYTQKREVQAIALLQKSYNRAAVRDFEGAIAYLKQIHPETSIFNKAEKKIQEYNRKQEIRLKALLEAADRQASESNYLAAITSLEKIPADITLAPEVQEKTTEYIDKFYVWADSLVEKANQEATEQDYSSALALLKKVPLGTPSYGEAREKIQEYARLQRQQEDGTPQTVEPIALTSEAESVGTAFDTTGYPFSTVTTPVSRLQDLNPGNYLREISPN